MQYAPIGHGKKPAFSVYITPHLINIAHVMVNILLYSELTSLSDLAHGHFFVENYNIGTIFCYAGSCKYPGTDCVQ